MISPLAVGLAWLSNGYANWEWLALPTLRPAIPPGMITRSSVPESAAMPTAPFPIDSRFPAMGTTIFTIMSRMAAECGAINLSQGFP